MLMWSHRYDLFFKLLALTALIAPGILLGIRPSELMPAELSPGLVDAGGFVLFACVMAIFWVLVWRPFLGPASTWMHVRSTFGVRPTWAEARELTLLFSLSLTDLQWRPSTDVLQLAVEQRLPELRARAAREAAAAQAGYLARTREGSKLGKLLQPDTYVAWTVVMLAGMGPIALGALFQAGPASFLAAWTESSDGTYYPQFSFGLGAIAWALVTWGVAYAFDRALGRKGERGVQPL
jgi:hypothetical protein